MHDERFPEPLYLKCGCVFRRANGHAMWIEPGCEEHDVEEWQ